MQQLVVDNFSFAYPIGRVQALRNVSFEVRAGEFLVLCGRSGCGKTTLLRALHPVLAPAGERAGRILWNGAPIETLDRRTAAEHIGVVTQDPESGIVTDKVWHELAFGPENLGLPTAEIRLRVAEIAQYFGIDSWFDQRTATLSGGQKQLLNLASATVLRPQLLLLDEPTAQMDPIAATEFLATLSRINRELGVTVILSEHRLEEAIVYADRVLVLEAGRLTLDASPAGLSASYDSLDPFVQAAMPTPVRVFAHLPGATETPLTARDGAAALERCLPQPLRVKRIDRPAQPDPQPAVTMKNISFRYEKDGADVLRRLDLTLPAGRVTALLGGNGAGKSTLLRLLAGLRKPTGGRLRLQAKTALLPQNAALLFTQSTVRAELQSASDEAAAAVAAQLELEPLLERHPYDLSGGEQQRAALAKLLLNDPDLLLLDEPTKGMDCAFKLKFAQLLAQLKAAGKTVLLVSHDAEFCAAHADDCALLFDGEIACMQPTAEFFCNNYFYTTAAHRMSRRLFENCVTDKDVISLCRQNL